MSQLAILGGMPVRESAIPWITTIGNEEKEAVARVMDNGNISAFIGRAGEGFLGGEKVREFENDFKRKFGSRFAITVNSATTALHTAIAACEVGPGDEVLVTPYTMVATASAVLMNNAVPVFVDIDPDTYNLNPAEIEKWITSRTKAIVVANIFGLPANLPEILRIARKHRLFVIEDNAQSPGASIDGKSTGTFGDLGVFSLNYHKVIHSGEGGVILTDRDDLAQRCQLIRNHGEMVVDDLGDHETVVLGNNYRLSELHAAIGIEQLKKLDVFLEQRRALAAYISEGLQRFQGLTGVKVPQGYTHSYYVYPIQYDARIWEISRTTFAAAMKAEGFPLGQGYQKPIYRLPMYQHKKVYNQTTFPFSLIDNPVQNYAKGLCVVAEDCYERTLLVADLCRLPFTNTEIEQFFTALDKVWSQRGSLYGYENGVLSRP
ncbi:DegT/DnrJ/EryC1/StrS family aminotransferase [Paenibacillus athensensis]|uniref:DegT/DnrJ/EryC1/StrS family aminotransferase n=1 Tax=Paenibacillus athensensis TaxID=1967502 RepID=A0A4Y8Q5R0_9BACL|nr:DegT/DnrJ/EryC1/StrS family aminotransferase [Paenibacillus athensensis]MCD1260837.1 DegT/DnrJ/EryC1/StrS family aminotransferase [Paenibacillus athensensis]